MNERKYTFVTVAHEEDWRMLGLQARSMDVHLPQELVTEIILIENSSPVPPPGFRDALRRNYGKLARKVRFLEPRESPTLSTIPTDGFPSRS